MVRGTLIFVGAMVIALIPTHVTAWAAPAGEEAPGANDPAALIAAADGSAQPSTEDVQSAVAGSASAESPAAEGPPVTPSPSPLESRALGEPNGPLAARPAASADESAGGWLARLDPRRNDLTRVLAALAAVLALLLLMRFFMRRAAGVLGGGGRPSGVIDVLARYPIARGQELMLLKVARRILLIHHAGSSMTTLSEMTDAEEVASMLGRMEAGSGSVEAARFRNLLRTYQRDHDRLAGPAAPMMPDHLKADRGEIVDLTRSQMRGLGTLLGRRRMTP